MNFPLLFDLLHELLHKINLCNLIQEALRLHQTYTEVREGSPQFSNAKKVCSNRDQACPCKSQVNLLRPIAACDPYHLLMYLNIISSREIMN